MAAKEAPAKKYIKITDRKGLVHIVPDNRHTRKFHAEQSANLAPGDKPKSVKIVTGRFQPGEIRGAQEFEEIEELEMLYENLTPQDSQNAALNSENEALKAQIEALQKQLSGGKPPKGGKGAKEDGD